MEMVQLGQILRLVVRKRIQPPWLWCMSSCHISIVLLSNDVTKQQLRMIILIIGSSRRVQSFATRVKNAANQWCSGRVICAVRMVYSLQAQVNQIMEGHKDESLPTSLTSPFQCNHAPSPLSLHTDVNASLFGRGLPLPDI